MRMVWWLENVESDPDVEWHKYVTVKGHRVLLVKIRSEPWICAFALDLQGCMTFGASEEEAIKYAEEAIELYLSASGNSGPS